jgi:hypothetical protein
MDGEVEVRWMQLVIFLLQDQAKLVRGNSNAVHIGIIAINQLNQV